MSAMRTSELLGKKTTSNFENYRKKII